MLFPTQITLLRSGTGRKRLSTPTRAGLASPASYTNPLNYLLFPIRSGQKNAGLNMTSFSLIPLFFSPASLNPDSASFFHSPACHCTYQPQALSGCRTRQATPKRTSCHLSSTETPVSPAQSLVLSQLMHQGQCDPAGKCRRDAHPANIHLARPMFPLQLEETQLFLSLLLQGSTTATKALLLSGRLPAQQDVCIAS